MTQNQVTYTLLFITPYYIASNAEIREGDSTTESNSVSSKGIALKLFTRTVKDTFEKCIVVNIGTQVDFVSQISEFQKHYTIGLYFYEWQLLIL